MAAHVDGLALRSTNGNRYWNPELADLDRPARGAPVGIHWGFPVDIAEEFFACHDFHIGAFTCETDRIPATWVKNCNRLDLVVPSTFCRKAFQASGATVPVTVADTASEQAAAMGGSLQAPATAADQIARGAEWVRREHGPGVIAERWAELRRRLLYL